MRRLFVQLVQPLLHALPAFDDKADLRLQPSDLGAGLVKQPLRLVDLVTRGVVRLPDRVQIAFDTAQVGQTLRVGTLWQALGPQDRPWTLFVHLAKPGDRYETFAVNVQPQNGAWPATRWTDGDWWEDSTMLDLPNDLPPGVYDVRMGWFDERDGQRVGVRTAAGELTGDYATVGEIEVLP